MSEPLKPQDQHMPLITHLLELRDRILRMILGALLLLLLIFPFANDLYHFVASPLIALLPAGTQMIATQVASPFLTPFKLTMVAAIFLSMPWILYQFWAFVAPGLYQHERKLGIPLLVSSTLLFYLGMAFAYFVVFPLVFGFMVSTTPEGVAMMTDISAYLDFVLTLFFAFGVAFEVPVATILLVITGVTTPESLAQKRPYIIVAAFAIGMLLTPPDVISQTLLAVPMWMLFEAGLFFSKAFVKSDPRSGEDGNVSNEGKVAVVLASVYQPEDEGNPSRFVPMTGEEMEAELDAITAQENQADGGHQDCDDDTPSWDSAEDNLKHANELRLAGDEEMARDLLYDVLQHGDEKQIQVARDVLRQMDEP